MLLCYLLYVQPLSFTGEFEVKTTQCNGKGLEDAYWERHVHVEVVFSDATKLHIDLVVVVLIDHLEVLDTSLVDSTVEVEHECLYLLIPFGRFIEEEYHVTCLVCFELALNLLVRFVVVWPY